MSPIVCSCALDEPSMKVQRLRWFSDDSQGMRNVIKVFFNRKIYTKKAKIETFFSLRINGKTDQ